MIPDLSHISVEDYSKVYEPAEDTYLFLDTLKAEKSFLCSRKPGVCLEIGSGSGCLTKALASLFLDQLERVKKKEGEEEEKEEGTGERWIMPIFYVTDVGQHAVKVSQRTLSSINASELAGETVRMDLLSGWRKQEQGTAQSQTGFFDIVLFNPPYVVTDSAEVGASDIASTWAGGDRGREVTDRLLPEISRCLAASGVFYLLCINENDPQELCALLLQNGFKEAKIISQRRAMNESLKIIRAIKA